MLNTENVNSRHCEVVESYNEKNVKLGLFYSTNII